MTTRSSRPLCAYALAAVTALVTRSAAAAQEAAPAPAEGAPAPAAPPETPAPEVAPPPAPAPATTTVTVTTVAPPPSIAPGMSLLTEPLAGWSDGTAFLRSPDNLFLLFPNGRLQIDGLFYHSDGDKTPTDTFLIRRARIELAGWIGPMFYFNIAGDFAVGAPATTVPVAQTNLATTDNYVMVAPWGDLAMLQVGQFDAPFTLENRTSDKYFDFMERSITVRAFAIPSNKEIGAMVHGLLPDRHFYYSLGVFNGDGQNYRNVDNDFDFMGRAWVAPFTFGGPPILQGLTVGGSMWQGFRNDALPLATQTTQGGFAFFTPRWTNAAMGTTAASTFELHQDRHLEEYAAEINAPINHKYGARWEFVWKSQPFSTFDLGTGKPVPNNAGGKEQGYATYGYIWWWPIGDDRIIGEPGLQLPARFKKFGIKAPQTGVMIVAKLDYLNETITFYDTPVPLTGQANVAGQTKVWSAGLGVNYWFSKRFRLTGNYVFNSFSGNNINVVKLTNENEFLFRFAIAL